MWCTVLVLDGKAVNAFSTHTHTKKDNKKVFYSFKINDSPRGLWLPIAYPVDSLSRNELSESV